MSNIVPYDAYDTNRNCNRHNLSIDIPFNRYTFLRRLFDNDLLSIRCLTDIEGACIIGFVRELLRVSQTQFQMRTRRK